MMNINRRVVIILSFVLSSCAAQKPPINSALVEMTMTGMHSGTESSDTLPLFINTPPISTPEGSLNLPTIEVTPTFFIPNTGDEVTPGYFIPNTGDEVTPEFFIPNTGPEIIPKSSSPSTEPSKGSSNNNKGTDKFKVTGFLIPITGFAPNVVTDLSRAPNLIYSDTAITLEIPSLSVDIPIVGVPIKDNTWDISWLWSEAGWLEGTAYPTMSGNSILTAHNVTADGKTGPFFHLKLLTVEDYVFIVSSGFRYIYKVDSISIVEPNDASIITHKEESWLTLVTCDLYDEKTGTYLLRVVVRAKLVEIQKIN